MLSIALDRANPAKYFQRYRIEADGYNIEPRIFFRVMKYSDFREDLYSAAIAWCIEKDADGYDFTNPAALDRAIAKVLRYEHSKIKQRFSFPRTVHLRGNAQDVSDEEYLVSQDTSDEPKVDHATVLHFLEKEGLLLEVDYFQNIFVEKVPFIDWVIKNDLNLKLGESVKQSVMRQLRRLAQRHW